MGRILAGIDGSEAGRGAAQCAARLARRLGDSVTLVCVVPPVPAEMRDAWVLDTGRLAEENLASARELLRKTVEALDAKIRVEMQVLTGHPGAVLEELARAEDVDMVVVGSHGLNPVERAMLGSVSSRLARTCRKPVVVIPPPAWAAPVSQRK